MCFGFVRVFVRSCSPRREAGVGAICSLQDSMRAEQVLLKPDQVLSRRGAGSALLR